MSYDAYAELSEGAAVGCYEVAMAEPVRHFAVNLVREKFPLGDGGAVLQNTGRFGLEPLLGVIGQFGSRSMQSRGLLYPYWENAARCVEDWCSLLLQLSILLILLPAVSLAVFALHLGLAGAWMASLIDMSVRLILVYRRFTGGKWHAIKI